MEMALGRSVSMLLDEWFQNFVMVESSVVAEKPNRRRRRKDRFGTHTICSQGWRRRQHALASNRPGTYLPSLRTHSPGKKEQEHVAEMMGRDGGSKLTVERGLVRRCRRRGCRGFGGGPNKTDASPKWAGSDGEVRGCGEAESLVFSFFFPLAATVLTL